MPPRNETAAQSAMRFLAMREARKQRRPRELRVQRQRGERAWVRLPDGRIVRASEVKS